MTKKDLTIKKALEYQKPVQDSFNKLKKLRKPLKTLLKSADTCVNKKFGESLKLISSGYLKVIDGLEDLVKSYKVTINKAK